MPKITLTFDQDTLDELNELRRMTGHETNGDLVSSALGTLKALHKLHEEMGPGQTFAILDPSTGCYRSMNILVFPDQEMDPQSYSKPKLTLVVDNTVDTKTEENA